MAITPWYVGMTATPLAITLLTDSSTVNLGSTQASALSMIFKNTDSAQLTETTGTGTFTILAVSPAIVQYVFSSADVANPGNYQLIVKVTPSGPFFDPIAFTIKVV
jgi:hypothetical protein